MTLHENLERRRRQKIATYRESGACHLCECTSGRRSFRRFVGHDTEDDDDYCDSCYRENDDEEEAPAMRSCMCHGNSFWPYPLKVCEMCVADDATTGRIRCCAICGVVACDENCGVELVEVTDREEWENAGCLECRGMESFSEMELFRRRPYPNGMPRATRICTNCVELFSLFSFGVKYHFTCRYFKCNRLLVPSHVVELKRFLKPFPLSLLPEELMNSIVDFLGGKDLFYFGLVCTSMFRKVEHVSRDVVTRFNHELPTGPTQIVRSDKKNCKKMAVYAEGKNMHSLRAPEDGKSWVGVLNQMEQITRDIFYFDFQIKAGDDGAAMRYLRKRDKINFERVLSKGTTAAITPYFETGGFSMRGGQVLVTKYKWHHSSLLEEREERDRNMVRSIVFSTDRLLTSGVHRVIVRYCCFCEGESLGSVGVLRQTNEIEGESVTWARSSPVVCQARMEENVFGMEYDADARVFKMYQKNSKTNKMELAVPGGTQTVPDDGGELRFAAALSAGSVGVKGNQMSVRACNDEEWKAFLEHKVERNVMPRIRGRGRRGEERLMRYLDHRALRAMVGERGGEGEEDDHAFEARVEVEHMMDMLMEDAMEVLNDDEDGDDGGADVEEEVVRMEVAPPPIVINLAAAE